MWCAVAAAVAGAAASAYGQNAANLAASKAPAPKPRELRAMKCDSCGAPLPNSKTCNYCSTIHALPHELRQTAE